MDVAVDKHLQITLSNIGTSAKYSCLINDAKSLFISLNVTVLPQKISRQTYEKLRIWSDLGTSEENLTLNLRKTFDQCSIRSFGSAVFNPQSTRYNRRFSLQLCSANYPLQHPHFTPGWQNQYQPKGGDVMRLGSKGCNASAKENQNESQNSRMSAAERRKSTNLEDAVEFIDLRLSRKPRLLHEKLRKYAADRPHVDGRAVFLGAQQQLRRPVPKCHHDWRVGMQRRAVLASQTKVTDLYQQQHTTDAYLTLV